MARLPKEAARTIAPPNKALALTALRAATQVHRDQGLACLILRTSRFFPEEDDHEATRQAYGDENVKTNEFLYRRVELEDVVSAHLLALKRAPSLGFGGAAGARDLAEPGAFDVSRG